MANKVLGMHRLKNKVNRNAFDLSHRHMFTAQIGELLPVFTQWVNPNETFKIGYNGKTRTAALNTDAFTRVRENIQYYFVPFQSLWKYFEQQVNNMTKGDAGQNISKIASSSMESSVLTTSMPYISYVDLADWLREMYTHSLDAVSEYIQANPKSRSAVDFKKFCDRSNNYSDVFVCDGYRLSRAAKLLMALGYGNFSAVIQFDIYAMIERFISNGQPWDASEFQDSKYSLDFDLFETPSIINSPNLSIFPLLAYHKICNDHYRNEKWQPYEPWTCNIDYLLPDSSMDAKTFIQPDSFTRSLTSLIDLENSNLPIDYFTSVLPRAQYGDESAATVDIQGPSKMLFDNSGLTPKSGALFDGPSFGPNDTLIRSNTNLTHTDTGYISSIQSTVKNEKLVGFAGDLFATGALKISALRSATALQKYKEIQNSNDPDFAAQVLAHFGIKPKVDSRVSVFIGGDDKTLSINPQVNTNFQDGGEPEIKAIGIGDLSAGCKFTATTYGMIIGIYRAVPQLDYAHVIILHPVADIPAGEILITAIEIVSRRELAVCGGEAFEPFQF